MKVTDAEREGEGERGVEERQKQRQIETQSHQRRGGLAAAGLFQGWLAFPWRQSEGAMSYALVGTDAAGYHPTPTPH